MVSSRTGALAGGISRDFRENLYLGRRESTTARLGGFEKLGNAREETGRRSGAQGGEDHR